MPATAAITATGFLLPCTTFARLLLKPKNFNHHHYNTNLYYQLGIQHCKDPKSSLSVYCSFNQGLPQDPNSKGFWNQWKANSAEMSSKIAKLGLAAVLAYGLFDGVTYTSFFVLAFLGYEKSTGKNPAANLQALLGVPFLLFYF